VLNAILESRVCSNAMTIMRGGWLGAVDRVEMFSVPENFRLYSLKKLLQNAADAAGLRG
jgi:hypothetical protein